jgi:hypothetical protein
MSRWSLILMNDRFWMTLRLQALFPLSRPVADATVEYCEQRTDDPALLEKFALRLGQVRIVTQPKPVFDGQLWVPWNAKEWITKEWIDKGHTRELVDALNRARVLEGREKDAVYEEFALLALRQKYKRLATASRAPTVCSGSPHLTSGQDLLAWPLPSFAAYVHAGHL